MRPTAVTVDSQPVRRYAMAFVLALLVAAVVAAPASAARGGPDAGGWSWVDQDEPGVTAISSFPSSWTVLANPLPDEAVFPVPIGFSITLYGVTSSTVWVSSNGWISVVDPLGAAVAGNTAIPDPGPSRAAIYYQWDDLQSAAGSSFAQHGATADGHLFLFRHYQASSGSLIQLYVELNRNGMIRLQYVQHGDLDEVTIGIEDETDAIGHQLVHDGTTATGFVPRNGTIVIFYPQSTPDCASAASITCPTTIDSTTTGNPNLASSYGCGVGAYDGAEAVYALTIPAIDSVTIDLTNLGGRQVGIIVLQATCDGTFGCVASGPPPLQLPVIVPGDYFIVVDGRTPADDGDFRLTVTCNAATQAIGCGSSIPGAVTAGVSGIDGYDCRAGDYSGSEELYAFTLGASQTVIATLASAAPLDLMLLDATTLTPVQSPCLRGHDSVVGFYDLPPGDYILAVDGPVGSVGGFNLDLRCPAQVAATAIDCGDLNVAGSNLPPNLIQSYACSPSTYGLGEAYFRFQSTQYQTVTATVTGANRQVFMFRESGGPSTCSGYGDPTVTIAGVGPDDYLFAVDSRFIEGPIDLTLTCQPLTTAPTTCNTTIGGATAAVSQFDTYACRSGVLDGGEEIWVLQNPVLQPLSVALLNTAPGIDLDVMLFDRPFNAGAPDCSDFGDQVAHITAAPPGDYLVVIDGAAATSGATYDLLLECGATLTCGGTALQCNDLMTGGDTSVGASDVWRYGDVDHAFTGPEITYSFVNPVAQPIGFWLRNPSDSRLDILLVDSCDRERVVGWGDERIQFASLPPGSYDVVVDGREGAAGTFELVTFCGGALLDPPVLTATVSPGQCIQEQKTLFLPTSATAVDVMFSFDLSISMGAEVNQLRLNAQTLWTELSALIPSLRFGLASFVAYPFNLTGCPNAPPPIATPWPFMLHQPLTSNFSQMDAALSSLFIPGGAAEPYTRALWEATNNPDIGWRQCIPKLWTNWGDEDPQMDCDAFACIGMFGVSTGSDPGLDEILGTADDPALLPAVDAMSAAGIVLLPIESSGTQLRFDIWDCLAQRTGGRATAINSDGTVPGGIGLSDLLADIILDYVDHCDQVQLVATGAGAGWVTVTPGVLNNITTPYFGQFTIDICIPPGTPPGSFPFTIDAQCLGDGSCLSVAAQQTVEITVCTPPTAAAAAPLAVCQGETVTLDGSGTTGCSPLEYQWSEGATVLCPWSASPTCAAMPVGPLTTYTLESRCAVDQCSDSTTIDVAVIAPPVADVVAVPPLCAGDTVTLDATPSSGCSGGLEYQWSDGATVLCPWQPSATCAVVPPAGTTSYSLDVRCIGTTSCADSTTVDVVVEPPPLAVTAPPPLICEGGSITLDATASTGCAAAGGLEYQWRAGAAILCPWQPSPTCGTNPTPGLTSYTVDIRCASLPACVDGSSLQFTPVPAPLADAGPPATVCLGDTVVLDGAGSTDLGCPAGLEYEWRDGATVTRPWSTSPTWSPPATTFGSVAYTLVVRCIGNPPCEADAVVVVAVQDCTSLAVTFDDVGATWSSNRADVKVRWTTLREDGSTAFLVERATSSDGPFTDVAIVAAVGPSAYELVDTNAPDDPTTRYRVVEYTVDGRGDETSPFAAVASPANGSGRDRGAGGRRR